MLTDFGFYVDDSVWIIYLERERVCTSRKRGKIVLRVKPPTSCAFGKKISFEYILKFNFKPVELYKLRYGIKKKSL